MKSVLLPCGHASFDVTSTSCFLMGVTLTVISVQPGLMTQQPYTDAGHTCCSIYPTDLDACGALYIFIQLLCVTSVLWQHVAFEAGSVHSDPSNDENTACIDIDTNNHGHRTTISAQCLETRDITCKLMPCHHPFALLCTTTGLEQVA